MRNVVYIIALLFIGIDSVSQVNAVSEVKHLGEANFAQVFNHSENSPTTSISDTNPAESAWDLTWDAYPTYSEYVEKMEHFASQYPQLCQLQNIGDTPNGRSILVLKISDNVENEEAEPEFFYSSTLHGDELTGFPLMIRLIDFLLKNYGTDSEITEIINSTEIFINPLANPDGTYGAVGENIISSPSRYNANGVDLNRNYPDNVAGLHSDGFEYQPETKAFMAFDASRDFVLSANFHAGTEVVNYGYDNSHEKHADHDYYERIASNYASSAQQNSPSQYYANHFHRENTVDYMSIDYDAHLNPNSSGVTQGSAWYKMYGGRQDYLNFYRHCRDITIELSYNKMMSPSELPVLWEFNKKAIIDLMKEVNYGIQGSITDENGQPIVAKISIAGHDFKNSHVFSNPDHGDYYRLIQSGTYKVTYEAAGFETKTIQVEVSGQKKTVQNVRLKSVLPLPKVEDIYIENDSSVMVSAKGIGEIAWYANSADATPIYIGEQFVTPGLSLTTSYFVESQVQKPNVGLTNFHSYGHYSNRKNAFLIFDCMESIVLQSVVMNPDAKGEVEIQLQDQYKNVLDVRLVSFQTSGPQKIDLELFIPKGNNLRLVAKDISPGVFLFQSDAEVEYPYTNGSVSIKNSSEGEYSYLYFYDWSFQAFKSQKKEVIISINDGLSNLVVSYTSSR